MVKTKKVKKPNVAKLSNKESEENEDLDVGQNVDSFAIDLNTTGRGKKIVYLVVMLIKL